MIESHVTGTQMHLSLRAMSKCTRFREGNPVCKTGWREDWPIVQHSFGLVRVQRARDVRNNNAIAHHIGLLAAEREEPHAPLGQEADQEGDEARNFDDVFLVDRLADRGGRGQREVPEGHTLVVGDVECLALDGLAGRQSR